jgi:tetratricopeptide (TPR) repeat protein
VAARAAAGRSAEDPVRRVRGRRQDARVVRRRALGQWWRVLAPAALLGVAGAVAVVVLAGSPPPARPARAAPVHHPRPALAAGRAGAATTHTTPPAVPAAKTPPTPVSPALATDLEARGHELLASGRFQDAIPILERAVLATGERVAECAQPATDTCLLYAYALYDLGRALRLSGEPAAAVPVLERRLRIDNQRPVVAAELALARRQTG